MAFYKDLDGKKQAKKDKLASGGWEDEGARYSGRPGMSGKRADGKPDNNGHRGNQRPSTSPSSYSPSSRSQSVPYAKPASYGKGKPTESINNKPTGTAYKAPPTQSPSSPPRLSGAPVGVPGKNAIQRDDEPINLLSGRNPIREAIKSGRDIEKLLVAKGDLSGSAREIVSLAREARIPVQVVERARLDDITRNHQGMLAFASAYRYYEVEDMLAEAKAKDEPPFLVILDGVTDPQNLGAIIRTASCVGAHGVIVPMHRAVGLTPAAVKASAGAVEHVKVARVTNMTRVLEQLKKAGVWLYAADMDGEDFRTVNFAGACAVVVGAEGDGLSRLVLESCDHRVKLPMRGEIGSLNASVAAGVLLYAAFTARTPV